MFLKKMMGSPAGRPPAGWQANQACPHLSPTLTDGICENGEGHMNILVLNAGSSSLKFQVISTDLERIQRDGDERLCKGYV